MPQSTFTADGSTDWYTAKSGSNGIHIGISGDFGGGSIAVEQRVNAASVPLLDNGVAVSLTAPDDSLYNLVIGDVFRLTLSGATDPVVNWNINGAYAAVQ